MKRNGFRGGPDSFRSLHYIAWLLFLTLTCVPKSHAQEQIDLPVPNTPKFFCQTTVTNHPQLYAELRRLTEHQE